ncbi:FtsX-like permease family protein [Streptomyces sp. 3MP-14]|uniref:FtsX-like permease family protein n=1 Tax=Streptomyces mimosae TaxID=2586635 RepID=A0A5N6ABG9_9ACTN|nr:MULTISPECIES: ABC transporter permease [Streptomyces]KAB8165179.1 FtsX-like permease family protein [Streptomyces mimosae]KAB8175811.1 FtsX-like permease family protein [Streptomyces sp. 3MP-14]
MSGTARAWARDLRLGFRLAVSGGAAAWMRTALSTLGVGLGVVVLLLAASVTSVTEARSDRADARYAAPAEVEPADDTFLLSEIQTEYRGDWISGRLIQPDAGRETVAEPPPGLDAFPAPGEMVVSPALARLLDSSDGALLADRLDYRRAGTIGDEGLVGSQDLDFYVGADDLTLGDDVFRAEGFGGMPASQERLPPALVLLVLVICVVLLMPVPVFVTTAVRFGGERRDRRLAALRLIGADRAATRRIAVGESLVGAGLGIVLGGLLFLLVRQLLAGISVRGTSAFAADIVPSPPLTVLALLAVPLLTVAVTLLALRSVAVEPLGVVRKSQDRPRRLGWRLVPALLGVALLVPLLGDFSGEGGLTSAQAVTAVVLLLSGSTALLPWLVERATARLRGGPVAWQLAIRRLQLSNGPAVRAISGIMVAVAGATALSMLFAGASEQQTSRTGADLDRAQAEAFVPTTDAEDSAALVDELRGTPGVERVLSYADVPAVPLSGDAASDAASIPLIVSDCRTLVELAEITDCAEGGVYAVPAPEEWGVTLPEPGTVLDLGPAPQGEEAARPVPWTVPASLTEADPRPNPAGWPVHGLLTTPAALGGEPPPHGDTRMILSADLTDPDTLELVRNAVWDLAPGGGAVRELTSTQVSDQFANIQTGLTIGAMGVLALIAGSMLVTTLEQLRERRQLLSTLVALGTRRTTLGASVLWQTAVPVVLGLGLASAVGVLLGAMLISAVSLPLGGWLAFLPMAGAGAGVIALVTLASLPFLWRLMRPDGLRTE